MDPRVKPEGDEGVGHEEELRVTQGSWSGEGARVTKGRRGEDESEVWPGVDR